MRELPAPALVMRYRLGCEKESQTGSKVPVGRSMRQHEMSFEAQFPTYRDLPIGSATTPHGIPGFGKGAPVTIAGTPVAESM
jgi:hypothetical protein